MPLDIVTFRRTLLFSNVEVGVGGREVVRDLVDNWGSQGFFSMRLMIWASWPIVVCS